MIKNKIIEFKDFSFCYSAQKENTLHNINLNIYEGEKIAIIGASGSGKSTLGYCLNALIPFYYKGVIKGELLLNDFKIKDIYENSKIVGSVLQDQNAQFIGLSVEEDIAFSLENDNIPTPLMHQLVQEIALKVKIEDLLKMSPHDLSGGQKQKVSLAGVMINEVKILLFDEPLANLDPASSKLAIELIDELHHEHNLTTIIIEHRLEEVLHKNIDRVIVFENGSIILDTTPDALLRSNILEKLKIRQPLYVSALKYANCNLDLIEDLSNFENIDFTDFKKEFLNFSCEFPFQKKEFTKKILELKNIHFSYEFKDVIENLNLEVYEGEMISLVGSNGAGKSTLSKLICGFEKISQGEILVDNQNIENFSIKKRGEIIGFVLQNPNAMICKNTIKEEIELGLILKNINQQEIEKTFNQIIEICGLKAYKNWPISALSFGQKKRVTIAAILALKPKILIVDEPTAGQDLFHYNEIMAFLKELNKEGITIIFITHDMHLMLEYTNRTIVLDDKKIICNDSPSQVLSNEEVVKKAMLNVTSLHKIASILNLDIDDFINTFIEYEAGAIW